ncbi:hypothetical protein LXA43DRAFT_1066828 [Ganoderma leucocontextum]|nr:hypothetical protein LXA43DRAFT_1066828 [Ganoderma leucocontextum]
MSAPTKHHFSRRSSSQPPGLPLQPSKKPREGSAEPAHHTEVDVSSDEDMYIPSAEPAASEMSSASGGELEDDDRDSDAVGAIAARAKAVAIHNRAGGPAKWDTEAKRMRYMEKYGKMTPEGALAKLAKVWRLPAYNHFKFPVIITDEDEIIYHRFICKDHPSIYLDHIAHEDSTSNLLRHVRMCEPPE